MVSIKVCELEVISRYIVSLQPLISILISLPHIQSGRQRQTRQVWREQRQWQLVLGMGDTNDTNTYTLFLTKESKYRILE